MTWPVHKAVCADPTIKPSAHKRVDFKVQGMKLIARKQVQQIWLVEYSITSQSSLFFMHIKPHRRCDKRACVDVNASATMGVQNYFMQLITNVTFKLSSLKSQIKRSPISSATVSCLAEQISTSTNEKTDFWQCNSLVLHVQKHVLKQK